MSVDFQQRLSATSISIKGILLRHPFPRIVYLSFDRFPSAKGAATHIDAFVRALGERFGNVDLLTIPSEDEERQQNGDECLPRFSDRWRCPGVTHHGIRAPGPDLFQRVLSFRAQTWGWWQQHFEMSDETLSENQPIVHFRSIFEGYPIARDKDRFCQKLVYEVNGLPSIELKYHYPGVAEDHELIKKLTVQENACLSAADLVVTVSQVNASHLASRGVPRDRIRVIPNGVDLETFSFRKPSDSFGKESDAPLKMLYSGTMSSWQGVRVAIDALALYLRDAPARLTLVGHSRAKQKRELVAYAYANGVHEHVHWIDPVGKEELVELHHQADVVLAPLLRNDRNLVQGCCPLKVLEAMASGTPLIASDLPVVRELVSDEVEALLVRPGSGKAIKDAMLRLRRERTLPSRLSHAARQRVETCFSWQRSQQSLVEAYESLA